MIKYFYSPPILVRKIFNDFQWTTANNQVLFTFDDGPIPESTETILNELKTYNIKAIFFCVGNNVKNNPMLCEKILSEGHAIGNHTFNHSIITKAPSDKVKAELEEFNTLLMNNFNYEVKYFRPPHGRFNLLSARILRERKLKNIMWSLLTYDFKNDFNFVKTSVDKYLKENSIVVLHDSKKSKDIIVKSINYIVEKIEAGKLKIGEPSECLK